MKGQICEESKDEQDDYEPFEGELNDLEANEEIYSLAVNEKTGWMRTVMREIKFTLTILCKINCWENLRSSKKALLPQYCADLTRIVDAGMDG